MEDLFLNIVRESEQRPGARRLSTAADTATATVNDAEGSKE